MAHRNALHVHLVFTIRIRTRHFANYVPSDFDVPTLLNLPNHAHRVPNLLPTGTQLVKIATTVFFSEKYGTASCHKCPPGHECSNPSIRPQPCPPGKYSTGQQSRCTACAWGYFNTQTGATACNVCGAGKYHTLPTVLGCNVVQR